MVLPPNELLHLGPDPAGASWNHFDLGQGLATHINYPQSQLGNSPPQGAPWWYSKTNSSSGRDVAVFSAPLGGATTSSNTEYARDELREYERDGTTKMAFDPKAGDHWIEGIYRVNGLAGLTKPAVCVQQAHDPNDDVIMALIYPSGGVPQLILRYNGTKVATLNANYTGGEFYLKTRVLNGTPMVYYSADPSTIPTTPVTTSPASSGYFSGAGTGWYYKSGSYNQTNELTDPNVDPDASIIQVEVRELKHWHSQTPAGGAWPTPATYAAAGAPVANAGADASVLPTGTFSRTATLTLNGATLTSQQWKILSGPLGVGNVLATTAALSWTPSTGTTTTGPGSQTLGVGGIAKPSGAITGQGGSAPWTINSGGTAGNPKVYDGEGRTVGRIDITADYVVVQNYFINAQSQYGAYIDADNVTFQNNDIKGVKVSGDGDLNAITMFGNNIKIRYNTAVNYVQGDPGSSHTDFIQTWVSSSHPNASSNIQVIGNKATGPSNPSRNNSIASIHQCLMVESAGHGGNSGGSGTPSDWLVLDNEFAGSWNQEIKLDCGDRFIFARNKFTGSSDTIFAFICGTGNTVYSSNTFGSGYGSVGASTTSGDGPADPDGGGTTTTTTPYPVGTYVLEYSAVTSAGTVTDTVTVTVTTTIPGGGGGGGGTPVGTYPSSVAVGPTATSNGSNTVTVAPPPSVGAGQFQICIIQDPGTENFTAVPAGWQLLDEQAVTNPDFGQPGGDSKAVIYYNTTGDNQTRSWTKDGTRGYHAVRMAWKDYSALGQHLARGSSFTTTPYSSTVTPAIGKALVVSVMCGDRSDIGHGPVSIPTGWTQRYNNGPTVNVNEIEWIAVAELQVDNQTPTGANVPSGTGTGTSNFTLTNADNCSMFSFVLEGVVSSGTTTGGGVSLTVSAVLAAATRMPNVPPGGFLLTALPTLVIRSLVRGNVSLPIVTSLNLDARVFPRGALIILPTLTFITQQIQFAGILLTATPVLRAGALPYRKPVLRHDYKYPPPNHPFRLIVQRVLDGEIVEWELPVDNDFEYVEQLSGPIQMHGSIRPEQISVQELALDGYAYWLHVEINQEIRASAILLPPQYEESAMNFAAEGVAAVPHYHYYDGRFSAIGIDPFSVVRTLWNYVQSQPQSDLGVFVSQNTSGQTIGEAAWDELIFDPATSTYSTDHHEAKPYELNWWDAKNVGEEIDTLSGQVPFDYIERHKWNTTKTDVEHYIDLAYPRIGKAQTGLLFNEENILELVPVQEPDDNYASAVLVIGVGDGEHSIRAYRAEPVGNRIRRQIVITDKSIDSQQRADARAAAELAAHRSLYFQISEIVVDAYHHNAPIGSYGVGDDVQVQVEIPWLMEIHTAWYRITSITNKPSSDKVRLGLVHSDTLLDTSDIYIEPDHYEPLEPPLPPGATNWKSQVQLPINTVLAVSANLPVPLGTVTLTVTKTLTLGVVATYFRAITLTVGKTLTASGIATGASAATVTLIANKSISVGAILTVFATTSLNAVPTLSANGIAAKPGAVSLAATTSLTAGANAGGGAINLTAGESLTVGNTATLVAATSLAASTTLSAGASKTMTGAVALSVGKTLTANGTVTSGTTTTQLGKTSDGASSSASSGNKTVVSSATASASGNVTAGHARLWVDTGTASVQMVVYADSSGAPGALLGLSDSVTVSNTAEQQIDFTFSGAQQAAITSGVTYWIGFTWADPGTNNISWSRAATASSAQQNSLVAGNPFGTPGTALSGPIDAFVDVVSAGGGGGGTLPVVRSVATGGKTNITDATYTVAKPAGLVAGDYLLSLQVGDADTAAVNLSASGFPNTHGSQTGGGASNYPALKIMGKVADSTDVAATNFTYNSDTAGDGAAILIAIQTGTYSTSSPVTIGSFTTTARTATMLQTAPSMTGVVNGLLIALFGTDTNNTAESYPSTPPTGMTFIAQKQGGGLYAMLAAYSQALSSTAATGTKQITPTPSGITTNGWTATALIVNPA
jgi:hypothetical protein